MPIKESLFLYRNGVREKSERKYNTYIYIYMLHKNKMRAIIRASGTIFYSLLYSS